MKFLVISLMIAMSANTAFAQNSLVCTELQDVEINLDVTTTLIEKGHLSLGAEYVSKGGGIDEYTGESVIEATLDLGEDMLMKRVVRSRANEERVIRSILMTRDMSSKEVIDAIKAILKKAETGLVGDEVKNLQKCSYLVFEKAD